MAIIPIKEIKEHKEKFASKTLTEIDSVFEQGVGRSYSGMSGVGSKCLRALQYSSRNSFVNKIPARISRIFSTGHKFEEIMIKSLESVGIEFFDEQLELIGFAGHWKGHIDGKLIGVLEAPLTVHLAEFKTMKDSKFKLVSRKKVKAAFPGYYDQMQIYMKYAKLTRALFMAINKDNCEYYIERINYDKAHADSLSTKTEDVFLSEYISHRIGDYESYDCRFCNAKEVCFNKIEINKNCRTCEHVDIEMNGVWICTKNEVDIKHTGENEKEKFNLQMRGCSKWQKANFFL